MTDANRLASFAQDLRFALRQFRKAPAFAAVTVAVFGLGIAATTAIFSVVNGVLLRPLPYPNPDRIVQFWEVNPSGHEMAVAEPNFNDLQDRAHSFSLLTKMANYGVVSVSGPREPVRAQIAVVSRNFFHVLGVEPSLGRLFRPDEQQQGAAPAAIVSYGFWQRAYGGSAAVLGAQLHIDDRSYTVVGVMPATVDEPTGNEIWLPSGLDPPNTSRTAHNWHVLGRLAPDASLERAQREVSGIMQSLKHQYGDLITAVDGTLVPLREQLVGATRPTLLILLGASLVLLLIACTNAVNLLVARMASRQGELAVRTALGAGRGRLVQQFLAESLVLALAGGVLGVGLAKLGVTTILGLQRGQIPRAGDVSVDWRVLLFTFGVSIAAGAAMALVAAWRGGHRDVRAALSEAQRTLSGGGSSYRIRRTLVAAQVAMTLAMLVSAGLLARSFRRVLSVQPGFITSHAVVLDLAMPAGDSAALVRRAQLYETMVDRLRALPGVASVGAVSTMPLTQEGGPDGTFLILNSPNEHLEFSQMEKLFTDPVHTGQAEFRVAGPGYFSTMRIPLLRGRSFDARDAYDAPSVALISQSLADTRWPGRDPIGQIIEFGNMDGDLRPFTVIGVVGDVRESNLAAKPRPTFYADYRQRPRAFGALDIVIATPGNEAPVIAAARRIARQLAPDVPPRLRTIEQIVSGSVANRRFVLAVVGAFGVAALLLATIGIYGVVAFLVAERRREIGIRLALGASRSQIVAMVLGQSARMAGAGIAVGAVLALAVTRVLTGFLYDVSPADPMAFATVVAVVAGVALLASWVPARRAAGTAPSDVMRN